MTRAERFDVPDIGHSIPAEVGDFRLYVAAEMEYQMTDPTLGNSLRQLALPKSVKEWSLRTLREKLIKIGAKLIRHARYVTFQMAEVLVSRSLFYDIVKRIGRLKPAPVSIS